MTKNKKIKHFYMTGRFSATSVTNLNKLHPNENFFSIFSFKFFFFPLFIGVESTLVIITNDATRTIITTT